MARPATKKRELRPPRRPPADKFDERRKQLAAAALQTLAALGYARTSLREIAQNSPLSHGALHYYFADKVDLITSCVRQYKADCVRRYDEILVAARSATELRRGFAAGMARTLRDDATMHRLWYDLRNQSLFEESFRDDVAEIDASLERMIGRIVAQYAELAGARLDLPSRTVYALFDGLFHDALVRHLAGDAAAPADLERNVAALLTRLAAPKIRVRP